MARPKKKSPGTETGASWAGKGQALIVLLPTSQVAGERGRGFEKVGQFRLHMNALPDGGADAGRY